jgi:hypothetical protein
MVYASWIGLINSKVPNKSKDIKNGKISGAYGMEEGEGSISLYLLIVHNLYKRFFVLTD